MGYFREIAERYKDPVGWIKRILPRLPYRMASEMCGGHIFSLCANAAKVQRIPL